jgi:nucleoside-diphosphate-sugar epimerase
MRERHILMTGYPGFIARRLVRKLLASDDRVRITAIVEASRFDAASADIARISAPRIKAITGDVTAMDLGLSGDEFRRVISDVTEIHHLAAVHRLGVDRATADRVNVQGTRNVLDLARSAKGLERLVHFSSAYVSGRREGVILEEELEHSAGFHNPYEATKYQAELLVRSVKDRLPITIIRPSAVVGDSRTGEIDRFDGVYHFGILLAASPAAIAIPLPGEGSAPLNIVPVDYLVDAVHALTVQDETIGKTFHVVDPNPLSGRGVYELVARRAGKKLPRFHVSANLTKALLRIPGLERMAPVSHQVVDYLNHMAFYGSANTVDALEGTGIRCPRFESYVDNLIAYVREHAAARTGVLTAAS